LDAEFGSVGTDNRCRRGAEIGSAFIGNDKGFVGITAYCDGAVTPGCGGDGNVRYGLLYPGTGQGDKQRIFVRIVAADVQRSVPNPDARGGKAYD